MRAIDRPRDPLFRRDRPQDPSFRRDVRAPWGASLSTGGAASPRRGS